MIEWLIGFLVAYWWVYKRKKKENKQEEFSGNINSNGIPYGYVRDGESVHDLR